MFNIEKVSDRKLREERSIAFLTDLSDRSFGISIGFTWILLGVAGVEGLII